MNGTPDTWNDTTLGALLEEQDVRARSLPARERKALSVYSLTKNDGLIPQSSRFDHRIATEDVSNYKVVYPGQVVYNPYVIWEGAVHTLRTAHPVLVSPVYVVWSPKEQDGGYLDLLLRTPALLEAYERLSSGAVNRRRSIRKSGFTSIGITVPTRPERTAVASCVETVRRAAKEADVALGALRRLRRSVLHHLLAFGAVPLDEVDSVERKDSPLGLIPAGWDAIPFEAALGRPKYHVGKVPRSKYSMHGRWPVIDQGLKPVAGYTDDAGLVYNGPLPLVLFGDHTRALKWIESPFVCGADGTKLLHPNLERFDPLFFFYACIRIELPSRGYNRHYPLLKEQYMPVPPIGEQELIASKLSEMDAAIRARERHAASLHSLHGSLLHALTQGLLRLSDFANSNLHGPRH